MAIKTTSKTIYTCSDGTEFADKGEALIHESVIESKESLNQFLGTLDETYRPKTLTMLRTVLKLYVEWQAMQAAELQEEVTPRAGDAYIPPDNKQEESQNDTNALMGTTLAHAGKHSIFGEG